MTSFSVNGVPKVYSDDPAMPLLWYLRENLRLKGTKFGCGIGQCGACTVHVNGVARRSCVTPMRAVEGVAITTIEGLGVNQLHPVQAAWIEEDVSQCGYCQVGQIMAVAAFLEKTPAPTDSEIDRAITNLCRCGTYARVRKAVHRAATLKRGG